MKSQRLKIILMAISAVFGLLLVALIVSAGYFFNSMKADHGADFQVAIEYVRSRASEFNINPEQVGVMGFSAGGHLAALGSTLYTESSRPDFTILAYPVVSMQDPHTHEISRQALLGKNPPEELMRKTSPNRQVTHDTPPAFIWAPRTDSTVDWQNSQLYADALDAHGVEYELQLFAEGIHGSGLAGNEKYANEWPGLMLNWLQNTPAPKVR